MKSPTNGILNWNVLLSGCTFSDVSYSIKIKPLRQSYWVVKLHKLQCNGISRFHLSSVILRAADLMTVIPTSELIPPVIIIICYTPQ